MWSIVPTGSVRHDSEELGTSFVIYPTASDGSAEVRTTPDASSLPAWAIWDQIAGWCREHHVTHPRWSVVRGGEPRAFAELVDALDGTLTDSTDVLVAPIDAALALPALVTATRAEVIRTRAQVVAGGAVSRRVWGSCGDDAGIEAKVAALATPVGTRAGFGVLARDPSGAVVSVGECTLESVVARLWGACTLETHRGQGAYTAVLRERLATARTGGATVALARARTATSAPIMGRNGFTCYATYDKYAIQLNLGPSPDLD
jgi:hypothetical protein